MQAYCIKDAKMVEIKNAAITLKNGRPATRGICPICGNKVFTYQENEGHLQKTIDLISIK